MKSEIETTWYYWWLNGSNFHKHKLSWNKKGIYVKCYFSMPDMTGGFAMLLFHLPSLGSGHPFHLLLGALIPEPGGAYRVAGTDACLVAVVSSYLPPSQCAWLASSLTNVDTVATACMPPTQRFHHCQKEMDTLHVTFFKVLSAAGLPQPWALPEKTHNTNIKLRLWH